VEIKDLTSSDIKQLADEHNRLVHTFGALAELGVEVSNSQNFHDTIRTSLHLLLGSLAIMRGGVARYSRFGHELNMLAMRGIQDDFPLSLAIGQADARRIFAAGLCPVEISQARSITFFQQHQQMFERCGIDLLVPLVIHDESVGIVFLGRKATGEAYTTYDQEVICAMARHIGVAISHRNMMSELERRAEENEKLYENLRLTYNDTVKAFAAAIDKKDKYTEGHSVRVGKYSEIIAQELGWSEPEVEGAAVAGYLHDVGKITVERKIINAPYRINAKESAELNKHPGIGFEILSPINHPYADVPLAAKYHHERLDGRGYPDGLYDREIPFIAKVVNLADSFDAMTTDRPYKRRRPMNEIFEDLQRNAGKQFEPQIVTSFFRGMYNELTGETKEKRFRKLLGREYMETDGIVSMLRSTLNDLSPTSPLTFVAFDHRNIN
jgi:HD-GYP domain-containing protein (c-di-GMP phosphodiesterase class II)